MTAVLLLCACGSSNRGGVSSAGGRPEGASPADVLTRVYDGLLFTARQRAPDTLFACSGEAAPEKNIALADYAILPIVERGDTARAGVALTSVARAVPSLHVADRWNASLGIYTDTVYETLVRTPGGWKLCEPSGAMIGFLHESSDAQTDWSPTGASWLRVANMADSLRMTRNGVEGRATGHD